MSDTNNTQDGAGSERQTDELSTAMLATWNIWFKEFCMEKKHLERLSPRTISSYQDAWKAFQRYQGRLSDEGIKQFVMNASMAMVSPGAINSFSRSLNSFFGWLQSKAYLKKPLKIKMLKTEKRVLRTYKPKDVERILFCEPQTFGDRRIIVLLILLVDTGIRISEALTLTWKNVDLEDLEITVHGKGNKERTLPITNDSRKALLKWSKEREHAFVFGTTANTKTDYNNLRRDFRVLLKKVGVDQSEGCFHTFRRYFAKQYVKAGSNLFDLQKMLGHNTLDMVKRYTEIDLDDLKAKHKTASPIRALRLLHRRKHRTNSRVQKSNDGTTTAPGEGNGGNGGNTDTAAGGEGKPKARLIKKRG